MWGRVGVVWRGREGRAFSWVVGGLGIGRAGLICVSGMFFWLQKEGRPAGRWEQEGCEDLRTPGQGFWRVGGG